jgi:lysophospholipase L1-like esterase
MKFFNLRILLISLLLVQAFPANAQFKTSGKSVVWTIGFGEQFKDNINLSERYADEIKAISAKTENDPSLLKDLDVLFVGSSSVRGWRSVYDDMKPLKVVNNGFGGATIRDILYRYNEVVKPFRAPKVVLYVENDITNEETLDTYIIFDLFRIFVHKVQKDFPGVKVYLVSFKPSPSRAKIMDKQILINNMLADYAARTENVEYIDVASAMKPHGTVDSTIFLNDRLHMNAKGYKIWTEIIKPELLK